MKEKQVTPHKRSRFFLDKKMSMAVYLAVLAVAVICRTIQLKSNMDFNSGKYIDSNPMKNITVGVLLIGFILIGAVLILGESRDKAVKSCILLNPMRLKADRLTKKFNPIVATGFYVTAALIVFDMLAPIITTISKNVELSTPQAPVFIFTGISALDMVLSVIMLICAVTMVVTGVNVIKGEGIT